MAGNVNNKSTKRTKWTWGVFWLLAAGLILSNHFGGFVELGIWSLVVAALAVSLMVHNIATLSIASLPIPLAALYYIFQEPLALPLIGFWTLVLVTLLVICGLHLLLPRGLRYSGEIGVFIGGDGKHRRGVRDGVDRTEADVEESEDSNNPYISMKFGHVSRYLHSDNLETAELNCNCGALEVYFDHVKLSPNGAEVFVSCKIGSIEMYVPDHWRVIDNLNTSLGNCEVDGRLASGDENAPTMVLTGSVSLGNVEVNRIKR